MDGKALRASLEEKLFKDPSKARERVEKYLDPYSNYAAFSFDVLGPNDPYAFDVSDLFALNFLDTPLRVAAYRKFQTERGEISALLGKIDVQTCLWQVKDVTNPAYEAANSLWYRFTEWRVGIGPTRASKLLARKRPHLVPILDRRVKAFYAQQRYSGYWLAMAEALRDEEVRVQIDALRPIGLDKSRLSLLRILDIAIWMSGEETEEENRVSMEPDDDPDDDSSP